MPRVRCFAEGKRALRHSEGCFTRLAAEIAKTENGRARLTTAYLRSLPRDEERGPDADAEEPAAFPDQMKSRTSLCGGVFVFMEFDFGHFRFRPIRFRPIGRSQVVNEVSAG